MNIISRADKRVFANRNITMGSLAEVQQEIITTERDYCKDLQNLENFLESLAHDKDMQGKEEVLEFIRDFKKGLIPLLRASEQMLSELEKAKNNKDFSRIFNDYAPYLKMYADYINVYEKNLGSLSKLQQRYREKFSKLEQALLERSKAAHPERGEKYSGVNLSSHCIMPVQRLPKYELLLKDLIKNTPQTDSSYKELTKALAAVQNSTSKVNEAKRQAILQSFLQEAYSKSYNSAENKQARSITFSTSGEGFFKLSHIDTEKLQKTLKDFQIEAETVAINRGITQKECTVSAKVGDKQINFKVLKGKPNGGIQGKEKSKDFHVVIECDMATLAEGERRQLYQAAQNIGKAVITSMEQTGNQFVLENPASAAGCPERLDFSASPIASLATRLTSLQGSLAQQAEQSVGERAVLRRISSTSGVNSPQSVPLLETDKPTRMLNNELSLKNVARRVQESIASYNAVHQNKLHWAVVLPENGHAVSVFAPSKAEPNKTEPIFSVKQNEEQTRFEFQEKAGISMEAALVAISAAESPVEIVSENIKDMEILAEAAVRVNATKETGEEPTEITFSDETMGFLQSKQGELKGALKETFEVQMEKRQHNGLTK